MEYYILEYITVPMEIDGKYFEAANLVSRIQSGDSAGVVELYSTLSNVAMPKLSRTVDSQLVEDRFHDVVVTEIGRAHV